MMTQLIAQAYAVPEMPHVLKPEPVAEVWQSFEITAYTSGKESTGKRPGDRAYGITSSGQPVQEGITAACPPSMAFGTRLEIEGIGERVCEDRGAAITEGHIDIYTPQVKDALAFGRQRLKVRIIEEAK